MYKALVATIYTSPLAGADNLLIGRVGNYQVVVGKGTQDGTLGVFFEQGGQLSEEFAAVNDLVRRKTPDGYAGGMFEEKRRVKAITLRGATSEGFWCPLSMFEYTGSVAHLKEGDEFDTLNGHPICQRYVTASQSRVSKGRNKTTGIKPELVMFKKHYDTQALRRLPAVPKYSQCIITEKLHGTSFRVGHVQVHKPIKAPWWKRPLHWLLGQTEQVEWQTLHGTRNVVLGSAKDDGGYCGGHAFRLAALDGITLRKGEVVYGELVGWAGDKPIMPSQDASKLKDIKLPFDGKVAAYTYGCKQGTCQAYIYRITQVNEDGDVLELMWDQVVRRAAELGFPTVPELSRQFTAYNYLTEMSPTAPLASTVDSRTLREGVVVRFETQEGPQWYKNKSFGFGVLEGYQREQETYVDMEETA